MRYPKWATLVVLAALLLVAVEFTRGGTLEFIRGDVDGSGAVSVIADALYMLRYLAGDEDEPPCFDAADVNGDGDLDIVDPVRLLSWGFLDSTLYEPPAPFPDCDVDPDLDDEKLECDSSPGCD